MIDILGVMYDFVRHFTSRNNDLPPYREDQIIRGWQNTGTLPQETTEFCVLTLVNSVRHGKPSNIPLVTDDEYNAQLFSLTEHQIQVDFCSAEPFTMPQATKLRADLLNIAANSYVSSEFLQRINPTLKCLYADDVTNGSFFDADKLYSARYIVQLHISEQQQTNFIPTPSFNSVTLKTGACSGITAEVKEVDAFFKG